MKSVIRSTTLFKILVFFLILTIPFYIMSLIVYYRSNAVIRENILSYNQAQISGSISILEKDIENIQNLQTSLVNDPVLYALAFSPENLDLYGTVLSKRDLRTNLEQMQFSSRYIREVRAYLFASGGIVSSEEGAADITEEDYAIIGACLQNPPSKIVVWQNRLFIGFFYPYQIDVNLLYSNPKVYSVLAELDGIRLLDYFSLSRADRDAETVLYFVSGNSTVSTGGEDLSLHLAEQVNLLRDGRTVGNVNVAYEGNSYLVAYHYSSNLNVLMLNYVSEANAFMPLAFYRNWLIIFTVISVVIILAFSYMIYVTVHRPLRRLSKAFQGVAGGDLNTVIVQSADEFTYIYTRFNDMVGTIRRLINEAYEQKILAQQAELRQLQSQINPHFLYNAFFSISTIAYAEGGEMSSDLAQKLGQYFRFVTRESSDRVSLANELEYAALYADIQEMRFSNRLHIIFDKLSDESLSHISLPPFILQPLIENALEHGLANKTSGGIVHIGLKEIEDRLVISVEDNGGELDDARLAAISQVLSNPPEDKKPDALCNIHLRLKICFGDDCEMRVDRSELGGLRVEIVINARR